MRTAKVFLVSTLSALALVAACSSQAPPALGTGDNAAAGGKAGSSSGKGGSSGKSTAAGGADSGMGAGGQVIIGTSGSGGGYDTNGTCPNVPGDDHDGDGWTEEQGDCNDCDAFVNPGAIDVVNYRKAGAGGDGMGGMTGGGGMSLEPLPEAEQIDEDCDGVKTLPNTPTACDAGLPVALGDAKDAAKAMGLCQFTEEAPADPKQRKWGVIAASVSDIAGNALSSPIKPSAKDMALNFGLLPGFGGGTKPREGERIFALSSGEARAPGQEGFIEGSVCSFEKGYTSNFPPGFPKQGSCGQTGAPHDGVALDLKLRVPTNAKSMRFNFRFFTCEFPTYVCEVYNDVFAVLMAPSPLPPEHKQAAPGNQISNIAFDSMDNVIGVNNQAFLTNCQPNATPDPALMAIPGAYEKALQNLKGYTSCKGTDELTGSGFEGHAASAWLQSQVPVIPGSVIILRFAIWDSQDGILDSTAVVDNFTWSAEEGTTKTVIDDPEIK